jgi:pimeloyl-ACP methyl ester carboxylesterase
LVTEATGAAGARATAGAELAGGELRPFRLDVPQADLDDLHQRLDRTRWPDELPGVGWSYGAPLGYVRELADYWRHRYDWRANERRLNELPQFTTTIDGQRVHFLHARSPEPDAMPLIVTHGWPSSVAEFLRIIGPLTNPATFAGDRADAFHVVAPSIPGFGPSGPTGETGWNVRRVATAFSELMRRLGYRRYGAHGGDWGAGISRDLGLIDPEHVAGVHVTALSSAVPFREPGPAETAELSEAERERVRESRRRLEHWRREEMGYAMIQSTRPQTLAYALTDSPVGQLAWIVEKFKQWTDSVDRPEDAVDRDQMLTNVSLYWFTGTAGSSARIYYETAHGSGWGAPEEPSVTPTGVAVFPHDISLPVRRLGERTNAIVHWTEFDRGGHFAAMEAPDLLVGDIRTFFRALR